MKLHKKKVLISGINRGIGRATYEKFKNDKSYEILGIGKSKTNIKNIEYFKTDLSDLKQTKKLVKIIKKKKIDLLINNAGINKISDFHNINYKDFEKIINVNLISPFLLTQAVIHNMIKNNWGRIINISSIFGNITKEKRTSYTISKSALQGMTKTLAVEYSKRNIMVNNVAPGFVNTELTNKILKLKDKEKLISKVPLKRMAEPNEIANVIFWLSSSQNTYMSGQTIIVDGGFVLK